MHPGDGLVYYSPRTDFPDGEPVQAFTAIGRVAAGAIFQAEDADETLFRREVEYLPAAEAPIKPLLEDLSFIRSKDHWGAAFRFGFLRVPEEDFARIANAMLPMVMIAGLWSLVPAFAMMGPVTASAQDLGILALMGSVQLGAGCLLATAASKTLTATELGLLALIEPILGPIWVWALLGEHPGAPALIGGALVLSAVIANQALAARGRTEEATQPLPGP